MPPSHADHSIEALATPVVRSSFRIYRDAGPGLLETVYELLLSERLGELGLPAERQHPVDLQYRHVSVPGAFRVDLLVARRLVVEVKATERMPPIALRQTLTYLRLLRLPLGLIVNFGGADFTGAVRRVVNDHHTLADSPLRIHNNSPG